MPEAGFDQSDTAGSSTSESPGGWEDSEAPGCAAESREDAEGRARETVTRLLAARARSRAELRQALLRKGIGDEVADRVLAKFERAGLVDDASFAEAWVQSRSRNQGLGRRAIEAELRRKGVDDGHVATALSNVDEESEEDRARELVRKRLRSMEGVDDTARIRRLVGMLARKGYPRAIAFRVVREELAVSGGDTASLDDDV